MAACLGVLFTFLTHYNGTSLFLVEHCYTGSGWFIRAKSYWQTWSSLLRTAASVVNRSPGLRLTQPEPV